MRATVMYGPNDVPVDNVGSEVSGLAEGGPRRRPFRWADGEEGVERVREPTGGDGTHTVLECVGTKPSLEMASHRRAPILRS
jgi:hypothetical protein